MKKKPSIKLTYIPPNNHIIPTDISAKLRGFIKFSFKYLDLNKRNFCVTNKNANYFISKLERFSEISNITAHEFITRYTKSLRNHWVTWGEDDVSENGFGIPNADQLDAKAFQFSISANKHGRVIGSIIDDVFYVIWLDPDHRLYK